VPKKLKDKWFLERLANEGLNFSNIQEANTYIDQCESLVAALNAEEKNWAQIAALTNASIGPKCLGGDNYTAESIQQLIAEYDLYYLMGYAGTGASYRNMSPSVCSAYGLAKAAAGVTVTGLDLFDVSAVTDFSNMFYGLKCEALDVSSFNVSNGKDFSYMFSGCESVKSLNLSAWKTQNAKDMQYMFNECKALETLTLSENFKTENVGNMKYMFFNCVKLQTLDLSSFDAKNVTTMQSMFRQCQALTALDLSSFKTANITNMSDMFSYCYGLKTIDLSSFNTANVTTMLNMFRNCSALEHIYVGDSWSIANVTNDGYMFSGCSKLPHFDSNKTGKTYAYIDNGTDGYLEEKNPTPT